ncbi:MAG TPA: PA2169 family four-helix-bundle protein [Allosphingosinicella sp.]|nr:PA2169 family four-helix-bundle protein [Allosphingosinicella sp.]
MMQSSEHDISVVNSLITTTIDSARGFERSAEDADLPQFVDLFRSFAGERRQVVGMLQEHVRKLGGEPNDDGSLKADLHRRWVDLRDAISKGGDQEIIEEVERGEDYLKGKYDTALEDTQLSPETLSVIREAYQSVRAGHDRASALKHGMQATKV